MGCGASSRITVVEPVKPSSDDGELNYLEVQRSGGSDRGDSAVSKKTTDSGLGLEAAEGVTLPGAMPRQLPSLRGDLDQSLDSTPRQESSEILEQLLSQGIIPAAQSHTASSGEAYSIMMEAEEKPRRRPPPRLEKLKERKTSGVTPADTKEDIEDKMRQAEERRQLKEDEMKVRLRTKSARHRQAAAWAQAEAGAGAEDGAEARGETEAEGQAEVEQLQPDTPSSSSSSSKTPDPQKHTSEPLTNGSERGIDEDGESGGGGGEREGVESRGIDKGRTLKIDKDNDGGRRDSLNMESDSTFQQIEDIEEIF
ncbi:stathmin domain-containing protein 1 isoform X2 [Engraulis encrasicolus]|uniref:stathmin domain-containing protein 1 isoform X2 n=1 Tax=Engraulis encrasicolus TaxID=184585 RepID=UPI002FCEA55A